MSSLLGRVFRLRSSRSRSRALPSYAPTEAATSRTFIGRTVYGATLIGSAFCGCTLIGHYYLTYGYSSGASMIPTLPASHSISINSPIYRHGKGVKLGDIVHAKSPIIAHTMVGKRVIGLPGDYVLRDPHGSPTAGGAPVRGIYDRERSEPVMVQVPEGHVWLAGDNMSGSRDSRLYGPVPLAMVESKLLYNGDGFASWESFRREQLRPAGQLREGDLQVKESMARGKVD